jgi:hypothetical protein
MAETTTYDLKIKFNGTGFVSNDSDCYVGTDDNEKYIAHNETFSDIASGSNIYLRPRPVFDSRYRAPFKINSDNNDIDGDSFRKSYEFVLEEDTTITFSATKYSTPYISFSNENEESFTFTINNIDDYDEYLSYDIVDLDMKTIASGSNIDVEDTNSYSKTINNLNPNSQYIIYFSVYDANDGNEYGTYFTGGDDVFTAEAPEPTVSISNITATTAKVTLTSEGSYFVTAKVAVAPEGYTSS